jgi:Uma2 family endonuclease
MATETTTKLTYEDYLLIPDDGLQHEIIDGEHYLNPAPNMRHQLIVSNVNFALSAFVRSGRFGRVLTSPSDVVLSEIDVLQPDVLFISNERFARITATNVQGAPDLVVEVLSESRRRKDEIEKKHRYEFFGVLEYWVVDPELDSVKIYRRAGDKFAPAEIVSMETGGEITTPLLPGFTLPIADVFAE